MLQSVKIGEKNKEDIRMERSTETYLYRAGLIFLLCVSLLTAGKRILFPEFQIIDHMRPCVFLTLTGYYCPGCGGTRSVVALLNGRFLVSAVDFPMVVYCAAVYGWFMISQTIDRISRHRIPIGMTYRHGWIYASLVIVVIHFVLKNVYFILTGNAPFLSL